MNFLKYLTEFVRLSCEGDISPELQARLFGTVFWSLVILAIPSIVISGGLSEIPMRLLLKGLALVFLLLVWLAWKFINANVAAHFLIDGAWAFLTFTVLTVEGHATYWLVPQVLIVVLARYLLNGRVATILGLITFGVDYAIFRFSLYELVPVAMRDMPAGTDWLAIAIAFGFLVFNFWLADTILRETLAEVRATQGRYRTLFENTNDAVFLIDTHHKYIETNRQAADLLATPEESLVGKSIYDVVPKDEAKVVEENFRRLENGETLPLFERTLIRSDGSRRKVEVSISKIVDSAGKTRFFQSVMRDVTERKRLEQDLRISLEEMESLAMTDGLTGLLNRRSITDHADAEWHRSRREHRPMCIAVVDLDNLKEVNDSLGHQKGDEVIVQLATTIKACLRRYDWAGRWGGDEFMLVFPGSNLVEAQQIAERLRNQYSELELIGSLVLEKKPYLSIGIAVFSGRSGDDLDIGELFGQADKALYRAKQAGRNRVEVYRDDK